MNIENVCFDGIRDRNPTDKVRRGEGYREHLAIAAVMHRRDGEAVASAVCYDMETDGRKWMPQAGVPQE